MEVAKNLGVILTKVPAISIDEGIDAVRKTLDKCWFDEQKCAGGLKALDATRDNGTISKDVGDRSRSTTPHLIAQMPSEYCVLG